MSVNPKLGGAVPVLKYWNSKGRAEVTRLVFSSFFFSFFSFCFGFFLSFRLIFEDQGVKYEDVRVAFPDWAALKQKLVESGDNVYGQLPVVVLGDKTLAQSFAINRYFAKIYGKRKKKERKKG